MEPTELVAIIAILLSLILLLIVMGIKRQLNEIKLELDLLKNQTGRSDFSRTSLSANPNQLEAVLPASKLPNPSELDQQLLLMVQEGQKISAIKKLREVSGMDLKSAKFNVDKLEQQL